MKVCGESLPKSTANLSKKIDNLLQIQYTISIYDRQYRNVDTIYYRFIMYSNFKG